MTRRFTTLTVAALTAALLLTGCGGSGGGNSGTPSATATPTPTKQASLNEPGQTDPPTKDSEAIAVSEDAILDFLTVRAQIMEDSGASPERIDPYADGPAREQLIGEAASVAQLTLSIKGLPIWKVDASQTTAGTLTAPDGTVTEHGVTYVRGCFDTSTQEGTRADGGALTRPTRTNIPMEFEVRYIAAAKSWLVWSMNSLVDQNGAPTCG